jgi:hypothetical protein
MMWYHTYFHLPTALHPSHPYTQTPASQRTTRLTILLAFQNCTTLIICFPAHIGNVTAPTSCGHVTFRSVHATAPPTAFASSACNHASGMLSEYCSVLSQYAFR